MIRLTATLAAGVVCIAFASHILSPLPMTFGETLFAVALTPLATLAVYAYDRWIDTPS
jgi:hypothetical protein